MASKPTYPLLSTIDNPTDLRKLRVDQLTYLADELRQFLIETVSRTGGHFGSNLGSIELTIALHYAFNTPKDQVVWDVGSQAYPHKILTGRRTQFHTNRQYHGVAPFPKRSESIYDTFGVGHSSTSISAAIGMACARDLSGEDFRVIACIGDGGMTGGMAFEGLNHAGGTKKNLIVVLNDNSMSISPSVGALSEYLTAVRSNTKFEKLKDSMWELAGKLPVSDHVRKALHGVDAGLRAMLVPGLWFERFGFRYVGPIDGHNIAELVELFSWLRTAQGPVLVHVLTEKGHGYKHAETDRTHLHGVNKFDPLTGPVASQKGGKITYSAHFSEELQAIAAEDEKVVAITPAMIEGSCLGGFQKAYPDRCFDVGIAEQHAVTFAAGLATQGFKPVAAIYSTFLQRAFDQVVHDVALQNLSIVFGIDRAGLVGEDGPTHHGAFDISYLRPIPNLVIFAPRDGIKTRMMLREALKQKDTPVVIRFPRGIPPEFNLSKEVSQDVWHPEVLRAGSDGLIIGAGSILNVVLESANTLYRETGLDIAVVDIQCIKPLSTDTLLQYSVQYPKWISVEENALPGGLGSALLEFISDNSLDVRLTRIGLPDRFVTHGDQESLLKEIGMDSDSIRSKAKELFTKEPTAVLQVSKMGV